MRIACIGYREWALKIYDHIANNTDNLVLIIRAKEQYDDQAIIDFKPDLVLFYGWSWRVSDNILTKYISIMLHPSPLPKYRGGSPIQNQIINNEKYTKVTLFIMNDRMDAGEIIAQKSVSLDGHLNDIFNRITEAGIELTLQVLKGDYKAVKQDDSQATYYNRRSPGESEITIEEIATKPGIYLYNKIRMLEDPYPNAFIKTSDGKKLKIKYAKLE